MTQPDDSLRDRLLSACTDTFWKYQRSVTAEHFADAVLAVIAPYIKNLEDGITAIAQERDALKAKLDTAVKALRELSPENPIIMADGSIWIARDWLEDRMAAIEADEQGGA